MVTIFESYSLSQLIPLEGRITVYVPQALLRPLSLLPYVVSISIKFSCQPSFLMSWVRGQVPFHLFSQEAKGPAQTVILCARFKFQ